MAGYTGLAASDLPGSVPAASDPIFQESNLQTFPPSDPRTRLLGSFQPLPKGDGSNSIGDQDGKGPDSFSFFQISSYKPYFNVDTIDVLERIYDSCVPHRGNFVEKTGQNPDIYGPFWICTTLVFVAAALGNFAAYLSSENKVSWQYDISKVNWAAAVFYGYACLVPLVLYFLLQYVGIQWSIVQLWCLYGYSLFVFIPSSVFFLVPLEVFRWIIAIVSGLMSATFLAFNIQAHIQHATERWFTIVVSAFLLQCCLALVLKICFF